MLFIFYTYQIPISFPANLVIRGQTAVAASTRTTRGANGIFTQPLPPVCARLVKLSIVN